MCVCVGRREREREREKGVGEQKGRPRENENGGRRERERDHGDRKVVNVYTFMGTVCIHVCTHNLVNLHTHVLTILLCSSILHQ